MGMVAFCQKLTSSELAMLQASPESVSDFIESRYECALRVDKDWDALHRLMQGVSNREEISQAIFGETSIGPDLGYGPAHFLTPQEVQAVAETLMGLDLDDLGQSWLRLDLRDAYAYWGEDSDWEPLAGGFERLRDWYVSAGSEGAAMLVYII